jgi:hypothetical protein
MTGGHAIIIGGMNKPALWLQIYTKLDHAREAQVMFWFTRMQEKEASPVSRIYALERVNAENCICGPGRIVFGECDFCTRTEAESQADRDYFLSLGGQ